MHRSLCLHVFHKYLAVIGADVPLDLMDPLDLFSWTTFKIFLLGLAFSILFMRCLHMSFFIFILREFFLSFLNL